MLFVNQSKPENQPATDLIDREEHPLAQGVLRTVLTIGMGRYPSESLDLPHPPNQQFRLFVVQSSVSLDVLKEPRGGPFEIVAKRCVAFRAQGKRCGQGRHSGLLPPPDPGCLRSGSEDQPLREQMLLAHLDTLSLTTGAARFEVCQLRGHLSPGPANYK
jgi:hypothetical protein